MGVAVKICGITNSEDAHSAAQAGADFIGVIVEIEGSPPSVSIETAHHIVSSVSTPSVLLLEKYHADVIKIANDLTPYAVQLIGNIECTAIEHLTARISCKIWKTLQIPQREAMRFQLRKLIARLKAIALQGLMS